MTKQHEPPKGIIAGWINAARKALIRDLTSLHDKLEKADFKLASMWATGQPSLFFGISLVGLGAAARDPIGIYAGTGIAMLGVNRAIGYGLSHGYAFGHAGPAPSPGG